MGAITTFLSNVSKYMALRERNYSLRLLKELYEDETKLTEQILYMESDIDHNPDSASLLQLYGRLKKTRSLITILEDSEEVRGPRED